MNFIKYYQSLGSHAWVLDNVMGCKYLVVNDWVMYF